MGVLDAKTQVLLYLITMDIGQFNIESVALVLFAQMEQREEAGVEIWKIHYARIPSQCDHSVNKSSLTAAITERFCNVCI